MAALREFLGQGWSKSGCLHVLAAVLDPQLLVPFPVHLRVGTVPHVNKQMIDTKKMKKLLGLVNSNSMSSWEVKNKCRDTCRPRQARLVLLTQPWGRQHELNMSTQLKPPPWRWTWEEDTPVYTVTILDPGAHTEKHARVDRWEANRTFP